MYSTCIEKEQCKFCFIMLLLLSRFSRVRLCVTHRRQPTRLPRPWNSPGKNTGVGCHFLLQCMKVKSKSEVAQSCLILSNPMDCSPPGSSVHGIFQTRGGKIFCQISVSFVAPKGVGRNLGWMMKLFYILTVVVGT